MSPKQWLALLCFFVSYLFFGASVFYFIERDLETERRAVNYQQRLELHGMMMVGTGAVVCSVLYSTTTCASRNQFKIALNLIVLLCANYQCGNAIGGFSSFAAAVACSYRGPLVGWAALTGVRVCYVSNQNNTLYRLHTITHRVGH